MLIRVVPLAVLAMLWPLGATAMASATAALEAASGTGWTTWWSENGRDVIEAAACFLDGVGLSAVFVGGVTGVGGVIVAAGLALAALACVSN